MDIIGMNRLAKIEHRQRVQALPRIPEYGNVNVSTEPGWLLRPALRLMTTLRPARIARQESPCYDCPPTLTQYPARR